MHRVTLPDTRQLTYREAGEGTARVAVLLHAFPLSSAMWHPQLVHPPHGWRLLAPDLAGFGGSQDRAGEGVALDDYASDVLEWLDGLGISRCVVAGLSMGGYAALALTRLAPHRLAGLVLADTKAPADSAEARAGRDRMLETLAQRGPAGVAEDMLPKLLGETTRRNRPDLVAEVRSLIVANSAEGIRRGILRLRGRPDAAPVLPGIAVPTLVVVGEEDAVTPPAEARALEASIPRASLETVPGAGHLSNLEAPDRFNAALHRFLATL